MVAGLARTPGRTVPLFRILRLFRRLRFSQPEARSSARGAVGISSGSRDGMDGERLMCCEDQNS
jgi:hypothetical protein